MRPACVECVVVQTSPVIAISLSLYCTYMCNVIRNPLRLIFVLILYHFASELLVLFFVYIFVEVNNEIIIRTSVISSNSTRMYKCSIPFFDATSSGEHRSSYSVYKRSILSDV